MPRPEHVRRSDDRSNHRSGRRTGHHPTGVPRPASQLEDILHRIDGRGYPAYRDLTGSWVLRSHADGDPALILHVDKVQADPFAPPSLMRVGVDTATAALPHDLIDDLPGRVATADFMLRAIAADLAHERVGVGIGTPTQEIVERSGVVVTDRGVEALLSVPLPADRRRVLGRRTDELLLDLLPDVVGTRLCADGLDALREHVGLYRDQLALQASLRGRGLTAFVPDDAVLPRASGDSELPLTSAVPFRSPDSLRVSIDLPSGSTVTGMGVPRGVTVIIGGGFHGKSTLLSALIRGVFPHVGGDGREFVLTDPTAVAVRAEDGRAVTDVNISPFIGHLPSGTDTTRFTTTNASGSTSQAAGIVEALEVGATTLLLDEDTCATNFMMRDDVMRGLVADEPITPFVDRIDALTEAGVSTILVAGASSAFLPHADLVLSMNAYVPSDVTEAAHAAVPQAASSPVSTWCPTTGGLVPAPGHLGRVLAEGALRPETARGKRPRPPAAKGRGVIRMGEASLDATATGVIDHEQTEGVARALAWLAARLEAEQEGESLADAVGQLGVLLKEHGLTAITQERRHPGHVALPRPAEIAAAANRYRGLRTRG